MDISAWLRGLGLERYEQAFRENAIDEAILPKLTAEDLKDLGVTAVGHRRILLDAIAALRAENFLQDDRTFGRARPSRRQGSRSRTPPAHAHVRRPRRFHRVVGAARSRGAARHH
ncbi:SAM domain-containing protein [Bradyrhizobium sp. 195]|uniref:SAM domain-containing protein n=1 Tax=Bradyrhizobium sp. 195 TaxID=2782662 RepID=UPI00200136EC|nr:SAM domain-containing protein [Bradyrhizobium sp. 195]